MAKKVIDVPARSLGEYRLLTGKTTIDNTADKISLKTRLIRIPEKDNEFLHLNIPLVSAAMRAVSDTKLAIALALQGGISIIPRSISIEYQKGIVKQVKRFKAGFQQDVVTLSPDNSIVKVVEIMKQTGYSTFPVTEDGSPRGKLLGLLTEKNFDPKKHSQDTVGSRMKTEIDTAPHTISLKEANKLLVDYGHGVLPLVNKEGNLRGMVFKRDVEKHLEFPNEVTDNLKRCLVGAAVSTHESDLERIEALVSAEADILVIDSSDGFSNFQKNTLKNIRKISEKIPVVGGNIITREGFLFLAKAGFDAVKIGMGIGSICITQQQKGTGRGQATAIMEVARARNYYFKKTGKYLPIIADGAISNSAHMAIALALGADCLMAGRFFVQFEESASNIITDERIRRKYGPLKEYWGEGSQKAKNISRYEHLDSSYFFEEGVEGFVPLLGSIYKKLPETINKLKASFSSCGCKNIRQLHRQAVVELQSLDSQREGEVHDIITF